MIRYADARRLADEYVARIGDGTGVLTFVTPKPYGWVFFYNGAEFVRTGDDRHAWCGNGPFVISRVDGHRFNLGSGLTLTVLSEYQKELSPRACPIAAGAPER